jgi:Lrp/AsnC family transcriptional regulator, regulator for asnA, asnC and gidA
LEGISTLSSQSLDATDRALIHLLQRDGRRPYTQLAKEVGLSEAAVRQRVQRMLDNDTMQIVAVTDPLQLGLSRQAMVLIRVNGDVREVADQLEQIEEVAYLVVTAGSVDLLAELVVSDDDALFSLLNDRIRQIPGVLSTETIMYLGLRKQTYQWGTR